MKNEKKLTAEQLADCKRLKALYESKKKELKLTQQKLADELDVSQGAVGHYLHGRNALNVKAVSIFAKLLRVDASEISPSIAYEIKNISKSTQNQHLDENDRYQLNFIEKEIIELVRYLPKDEVKRILLELRAKKTHYDAIFEELSVMRNKRNAS